MSVLIEFYALACADDADVSELCRRFGISRKAGYTWRARYQVEGAAGLADRSRRPRAMPGMTGEEQTTQVLAVGAAHPTRGGRKMRRWPQNQGETPPATSTITVILRRDGRLDLTGPWRHFEAAVPNDLWQLDFKGHFQWTQDGAIRSICWMTMLGSCLGCWRAQSSNWRRYSAN